MRLVRRGAVAVLLAASLTSGALVGVSLAATEDEAVDGETTAIIEIIDQDVVAVDDANADEDMATAEEVTTEESVPATGAADAAVTSVEG